MVLAAMLAEVSGRGQEAAVLAFADINAGLRNQRKGTENNQKQKSVREPAPKIKYKCPRLLDTKNDRKYNGKKENHKNTKHLAITYKEVCRLSAKKHLSTLLSDRHKAPGGDSPNVPLLTYMLSAVTINIQSGVSLPEMSLKFSWKNNHVTIIRKILGGGRRKN